MGGGGISAKQGWIIVLGRHDRKNCAEEGGQKSDIWYPATSGGPETRTGNSGDLFIEKKTRKGQKRFCFEVGGGV